MKSHTTRIRPTEIWGWVLVIVWARRIAKLILLIFLTGSTVKWARFNLGFIFVYRIKRTFKAKDSSHIGRKASSGDVFSNVITSGVTYVECSSVFGKFWYAFGDSVKEFLALLIKECKHPLSRSLLLWHSFRFYQLSLLFPSDPFWEMCYLFALLLLLSLLFSFWLERLSFAWIAIPIDTWFSKSKLYLKWN